MFRNKIIVVYVTKNKIRVYIFSKGKTPKLETSFDSDYTYETLPALFTKLKASIGTRFRLLLDDELLYVVTISLPKPDAEKKELIRQKAQEIIPENLDNTFWTYRETPFQSDKNTKNIQVIAVLTSFIEHLSSAFTTSDIQLEMMEPLSYALARYTERKNEPICIIHFTTHTLLVMTVKGAVIATTSVQEPLQPSHISTFFEYILREYNISPKRIVLTGNIEGITPQGLGLTSIPTEQQNLDPFVSFASQQTTKNSDEEELNIEISKIHSLLQYKKTHPQISETRENTEQSPEENNGENSKASSKKVYFQLSLILISLVFIIGSLTWFFINQQKPPVQKEAKVEITPTPTNVEVISPTPISTESANIQIEDYAIRILNGSGKAGVASRLSDSLKEKGYDVSETGNADRNDYETTEIRYKKSVPEEVKMALDKEVKTLYSFIVGTNLEENDTSDIEIIIGKE